VKAARYMQKHTYIYHNNNKTSTTTTTTITITITPTTPTTTCHNVRMRSLLSSMFISNFVSSANLVYCVWF
jgi:hypothetical protein